MTWISATARPCSIGKTCRILHLIRDPRDVLISAMHYHKASRESWLHEPIPGYDNLTYQRVLHNLPTKLAQYIFEMENSSASTFRDMLKWRYGRANCFEARYEDLRQDTQLVLWQRIMAFLGLDARGAGGRQPPLLAEQPVRRPVASGQPARPVGRHRPVAARVHPGARGCLPRSAFRDSCSPSATKRATPGCSGCRSPSATAFSPIFATSLSATAERSAD